MTENNLPMFNELPGNTFFKLNANEKIAHVESLVKQINEIEDPRGLVDSDFSISPLALLLMEELRRNVFVENVFEDSVVSWITQDAWWKFFDNDEDPLEPIIGGFLSTALKTRLKLIRETADFRRINPDFPGEILCLLWSHWESFENTDALLSMANGLILHPELLNSKMVKELIFISFSNNHYVPLDFDREIQFFLAAFSRFVSIRYNLLYLNRYNFVANDPLLCEKFRSPRGPAGAIELNPGIHPFVQAGVYLQALEDDLGELSLDNLFSIYGVGSK